jgi:asparagine synthase (glutamine-hydrolysing)
MFALAVWDGRRQELLCARDRFGVKPLYYHVDERGMLRFASEIKALRAGGVPAVPDEHTWRQYLGYGLYDHSDRTFFAGIHSLPAGHVLRWRRGEIETARWYDLPSRVLARYPDERRDEVVIDEYLGLLEESVRLRFRSDVPVGINLSGGLDSSLLLALVRRIQGDSEAVAAFTFTCGDARYDESPWVRQMLAATGHPWHLSELAPKEVPALAAGVAVAEDEPYGGVPSLAHSRLFAEARAKGVIVLLDGQGLDEQWAGYDYYARPASTGAVVQGSRTAATRDDLLERSFFEPGRDARDPIPSWSDVPLLNRRLQDVLHTKIPRALRFNDRISMMHSCELREPFLDHRLVELALSQPADRLIRGEERKVLLRRLAAPLVPPSVRLAPKRPVQTPQGEWLAGPLAWWVEDLVSRSVLCREWYRADSLERALEALRSGATDNSFAVWQIVSLALWDLAVLASSSVPESA